MNIATYLAENKYLPSVLRDFHDQKDVFKAIATVRSRKVTDRPYHMLKDSNWMVEQVYVIDFFLWFMALHGWTLQRSRTKVEFRDLQATLSEDAVHRDKRAYGLIRSLKDTLGEAGRNVMADKTGAVWRRASERGGGLLSTLNKQQGGTTPEQIRAACTAVRDAWDAGEFTVTVLQELLDEALLAADAVEHLQGRMGDWDRVTDDPVVPCSLESITRRLSTLEDRERVQVRHTERAAKEILSILDRLQDLEEPSGAYQNALEVAEAIKASKPANALEVAEYSREALQRAKCCDDGPAVVERGIGIGCGECGAHWHPGDTDYEMLKKMHDKALTAPTVAVAYSALKEERVECRCGLSPIPPSSKSTQRALKPFPKGVTYTTEGGYFSLCAYRKGVSFEVCDEDGGGAYRVLQRPAVESAYQWLGEWLNGPKDAPAEKPAPDELHADGEIKNDGAATVLMSASNAELLQDIADLLWPGTGRTAWPDLDISAMVDRVKELVDTPKRSVRAKGAKVVKAWCVNCETRNQEPPKPIIGQEAICPDGLGRVQAFDLGSGHDLIRIDTYVNNRGCEWAPHNVELIDPRK